MSAQFCGTCERPAHECGCRQSFVDLMRERLNGGAEPRPGDNYLTREWLRAVLVTAADLYDRGVAGGKIFRFLREGLKTIDHVAAGHGRAVSPGELARLLEGGST